MALEAYTSPNSDKVFTDVLLEGRQACYKARDAFYACLERESNKKLSEIASVGLLYPLECKKSRDQFVKQCRPTWVKHFDRQYASKKRLQRLLDDNESRRGPLALPQLYTFKPSN
ncbi:Cytochrome c oxidase assembly factor like [Actinidia chinensis var. chinensis]|uniref:Cytochrome c oxidase assembly factor like n=1 Tax=Actinidia chinensis var. chinensis TaxID=1590841 RepID=A0A2R6R4U3_ACTCC|nr:Cytochrome c oxidase assembly factor like [Actinidia chinensis var. chinensis]